MIRRTHGPTFGFLRRSRRRAVGAAVIAGACALVAAPAPALAAPPRFIQQSELAAAGEAVAVAAGGGTAIVGDPKTEAVSVFTRSGSGWVQQARLEPQTVRGVSAAYEYGYSVALSANGEV